MCQIVDLRLGLQDTMELTEIAARKELLKIVG
jgi:hypothetical protein